MSDTQLNPGARDLPDDRLLNKYRNVNQVLPKTAVAKRPSERFHRHDAESDTPSPACHTTRPKAEWFAVDVEAALATGVTPCRLCWGPVLEYLAGDPSSPIEYRDEEAEPRPSFEKTETPERPVDNATQRPTLSSLTDEVMINGGSKFHAPAGEETLCGRSGHRVVARRAVETHYEPCKECFNPASTE